MDNVTKVVLAVGASLLSWFTYNKYKAAAATGTTPTGGGGTTTPTGDGAATWQPTIPSGGGSSSGSGSGSGSGSTTPSSGGTTIPAGTGIDTGQPVVDGTVAPLPAGGTSFNLVMTSVGSIGWVQFKPHFDCNPLDVVQLLVQYPDPNTGKYRKVLVDYLTPEIRQQNPPPVERWFFQLLLLSQPWDVSVIAYKADGDASNTALVTG